MSEAERGQALRRVGAKEKRRFRRLDARLVSVAPGTLEAAESRLESDPRVAYAEPNFRLFADAAPNDPSYGQLWGLHNTGQQVNGITGTPDADIDAQEAWDVTKGSTNAVVAVIDTGVDFSHPDLGGSPTTSPLMWTNPGESCTACRSDGLDNDGNGYVDDWRGWDFVSGDGNPSDDHSHGTHVAGTIGAIGDNGVGVAGVSRGGVKIMALKFLDAEGVGTTADAVSAILYAAAKGAHVMNNSWGGVEFSQALLDAINEADRQGSLFVAAAGNDGVDTDASPHYPSSYEAPNVVSVAATNSSDTLSWFSNFGALSVDLGAPGSSINSTVPGNGYAFYDGTSMATPHVAGAAALARAAFPGASHLGLKALLLRTVDAKSALANTTSGGRLNVNSAVRCANAPKLWLEAPKPGFRVNINEPLTVSVLAANCAEPGNVTVTATANGEPIALTARGDGLYTGTYTPGQAGALAINASATVGSVTDSRSVTGAADDNYRFEDTPFAWIDATAGGTNTGLALDDGSVTVALPFPFTFFREPFTSVQVSSNGFLRFGPGDATGYWNTDIPDATGPNGFAAPYWDDLNPSAGGSIWYRTTGTAPHRKFVVAWVDVPHWSSTSGITFEAVLEEGTNELVYQYRDLFHADPSHDYGASATVGVESSDGTVGKRFSYAQPLLQPYENAIALRFSQDASPPPDTTITGGPPATTNATSATFTFVADETGSSFECSLDGAAFAACSSPKTYGGLSEGPHGFEVRARDAAGTFDPTPAARSWTIDVTPPETVIGSKPANPTNANSASFEFSSPDATATFECVLDADPDYTVCASPHTISALAPGTHTFSVRAKDAAGNVDALPASFTWTVDTSPPETAIGARPADPTNATDASFTFSSNEGDSSFRCTLDGVSSACASPHSYSGLSDGRHTFAVAATDAAGNPDLTPASHTWTVDTSPPNTTLETTPENPTGSTSARFTFSSEAGARFECKLDDQIAEVCTSPHDYPGPLADGPHTVAVLAIDDAGNRDPTPAAYTWTIDTSLPETTITSVPANPTNIRTASFTFSSTKEGSTFECTLDTQPVACGPTHTVADGQHTFTVAAVSPTGKRDPSPASYTWTVDTIPPETTLSSAPASPTSARSAHFEFSSEPSSTFECKLDEDSFEACSSPKHYAGPLAEGEHRFTIRAIDLAGNVDPTPASHVWVVDITAPTIQIADGPADTTYQTSASFSLTANEPATSFECSLDAMPFALCATGVGYTGLGTGAHEFSARATDAAGNRGPAAVRRWTILAMPQPPAPPSPPAPPPPEMPPPPAVQQPHSAKTSAWVVTATVEVTANRTARIVLGCRAATGGCRGSITLELRSPAPRTRAERRHRAAVRLGQGSFRLRAGERRRVSIRLTSRALALLRARHQLTARAFVVSRDAAGRRTTAARLVVLRMPRRPR